MFQSKIQVKWAGKTHACLGAPTEKNLILKKEHYKCPNNEVKGSVTYSSLHATSDRVYTDSRGRNKLPLSPILSSIMMIDRLHSRSETAHSVTEWQRWRTRMAALGCWAGC